MLSGLRRLFSSQDRGVDEVVVGGLVSLLGLCAISAWDVARLHHEFSPIAFGTGAATILAAMGGGGALRDKFGGPPGAPGGGQ